ncbi:hypothetical protein FACS189431_2900 [Alphaproteobacteria bacterium]|nr:hypothetical protein FACS189431_2900 [Alphaproteobacteria bacterium]
MYSYDPVLTKKANGEPIYSVSHQWDKNFGYYDTITKPARLMPVLFTTAFRCLGCDGVNEGGCQLNRPLHSNKVRYFKSHSIKPKTDIDGNHRSGLFIAQTKDGCDILDRGAIINLNDKTIRPQQAEVLYIEKSFELDGDFSPEAA